MGQLKSFRDLKVYQKLKTLHLEVHHETLVFPKFEMHELDSQVRRSSNSAAALIAEGWGSRHTNMYIEAINRAMGEVRETQHHIDVAKEKKYLSALRFQELDVRYDECGRMLEGLHQALSDWRGTTRTGRVVQEERAAYGAELPLLYTTSELVAAAEVGTPLRGVRGRLGEPSLPMLNVQVLLTLPIEINQLFKITQQSEESFPWRNPNT